MSLTLLDLWNAAPLVTVLLTCLAVLLLESTKKGRPNASFAVSAVGLAIAVAAAMFLAPTAGSGFYGMVQFGGFASYCSGLVMCAALLTVILSKGYLERMSKHRGEYYILVLFATSGMMLIASANDLIVLFLGVELMSVCLYALAGFLRTHDRSNEAALKYFLLGAFATGFLLYGIALVYGSAGSTNFDQLKRAIPSLGANNLFLVGTGLILVGLSFKIAAVPFHMWAPDVYEGAPTTVSAFMSTGAKAAAFAGIITVFLRTMPSATNAMSQVMAILAACSMIVGNVAAVAQSNIKRMLAYSSVAHAGYMLAGIAGSNAEAQTGVLFYLAAYTLMNIGAFAIVSFVEGEQETRLSLDDYAGFGAQRPVLAALMAVFMFSLAGIPPFAGFFGKYYVFLAAVKGGFTWLAVVGVLTSLVSAYYYLRVVVLMYFREGTSDVAATPSTAGFLAVCVSAILLLFFGLFPSTIVQAAQRFF